MAEGSNQNITQTQLDIFETPLTVPAGKLDADQYSADDLDGVTESIFGSGNMAYASLQASQTDAALNTNDAFALSSNETPVQNNQNGTANSRSPVNDADDPDNGAQGVQSSAGTGNNDDITADTDRSLDNGNDFNVPVGGNSDGNFASSTVGSVSASQLSSDAGSFAPAGSGLSLAEGLDGTSGSDGQDGGTSDVPEIPTPVDGVNGQDGSDGANTGGGDTTINIDLGDTTELLDTTIIELGDTITTLTTSITDITDVLGDVLNNITNNLFDITNTIEQITNLTENLTQNITNTLTEITNITNNVNEILDDLGDLVLSLDVNALDTGILGVDVPLGNPLDTNIDLDVNLNPAFELTNNIADLTGLDILSDNLAELGGVVQAAQNGINQVTDIVSDLNLNDPGASVDQLVETLGNLDSTLAGIADSVDDAVGGVLDNLGIGDGDDGSLGDTIDGTIADTGGLVDNLTGGAADDITDAVESLVDPVTDIVDDLTDDTLDQIGSLTEDAVDEATNVVGDIAENIIGGLDGAGIDDLLGGNDDTGDEGLISQTVDPVVEDIGNIANDLTGGATEDLTDGLDSAVDGVTDLADNLTGGITDGLLGQNNNNQDGSGDSDITADILGLGDGVEVGLDPVEDLVGDIDLDAGLGLFGDGETDNNAGDADITVDTGIDLVDNTALDEALDVPLDPVEEIVGDIDLDIDLAADLLSGQADSLVNNSPGGTGEDTLAANLGGTLGDTVEDLFDGGSESESDSDNDIGSITEGLDLDINDALGLLSANGAENDNMPQDGESSWTESTITDGGGLFDDIANNTDGLGDALPDPAGTVAEGIGALDVEPELDVGSIGGLFG